MVRLEKISGKNVWDALRLSVKEDQREFVASNDVSIIEAFNNARPLELSLYKFFYENAEKEMIYENSKVKTLVEKNGYPEDVVTYLLSEVELSDN